MLPSKLALIHKNTLPRFEKSSYCILSILLSVKTENSEDQYMLKNVNISGTSRDLKDPRLSKAMKWKRETILLHLFC